MNSKTLQFGAAFGQWNQKKWKSKKPVSKEVKHILKRKIGAIKVAWSLIPGFWSFLTIFMKCFFTKMAPSTWILTRYLIGIVSYLKAGRCIISPTYHKSYVAGLIMLSFVGIINVQKSFNLVLLNTLIKFHFLTSPPHVHHPPTFSVSLIWIKSNKQMHRFNFQGSSSFQNILEMPLLKYNFMMK